MHTLTGERFLIATDARQPQVNGVVRTLSCLADQLRDRGATVRVVSPLDFRTVPCPTYPEIRLSLTSADRLAAIMRAFEPTALHIATEGPIGLAARRAALRLGIPFTTSFHTRFPEYLRKRAPIPESLSYAFLRRFHAPATACLVPTESMRRRLVDLGFVNLVNWTRGFDRSLFRPANRSISGCRSRCSLPCRGSLRRRTWRPSSTSTCRAPSSSSATGRLLADLARRYPSVHFAGAQTGEALARYYASGDVFVFPSKTDTFGIVLIEALACGLPVAAYPEPGPLDVVGDTRAGCISTDLRRACLGALKLDRSDALERAGAYSWEACADVFLAATGRLHSPDLRLAG